MWISLGIGLALAVNKVRSMFSGGPGGFQQKMMGSVMEKAMQEMMKGGGLPGMPPPQQGGGFPGGSGFPSAFPGSGFPSASSPSSQPRSPAFDTTASPVAEEPSRSAAAAEPAAADASSSGSSSATRSRRRETRPRKSSFSDVGGGNGASTGQQQQQQQQGAGPGFPGFAGGSSAGAKAGQAGAGFSLDVMESLLRDPKMQEAMYQYLPENMRNKETFEWMMSNPQYREQLKEMMSKQGADLDPEMYASIKDIDADEMKRQLDEVGLTPSDIITKLMQDPPLAAAFQKPNVQRAIFEARDNPLAAMRYQDDPEVMMVFEKMSSMFPQIGERNGGNFGGGGGDFGGGAAVSSQSGFPSSPDFPQPPSSQSAQQPGSTPSFVPPSNEKPGPTSSNAVPSNGVSSPEDVVDAAVSQQELSEDRRGPVGSQGAMPTSDRSPISPVPDTPPS